MIDPSVEVYAPWRDQAYLNDFPGRKEMIDFCEDRQLPIQASHEKPYSTDANILGLTHEAGRLESLETPAGFISPGMGVHPREAPDSPEYFAVRFEQGVPVRINEEPVTPLTAIETANRIGGKNGVGIGIHTVENRFVGIKSRGVYESPAMTLLGQCYEYLLQLILDRRSRRTFDQTSAMIAEQIYQGYWYDPSTQALRASVDVFNRLATGTIRVELYKGHVSFQSAEDVPHSLYSETTASMEGVGDFDHKDSEGFLGVLGVSARALRSSSQTR
jgi:argininosuccinate synthase